MSKKEKEWKKKNLGKVRFPVPPPGRPHSDKSGDKGYNRQKLKEEMYNILGDYENEEE